MIYFGTSGIVVPGKKQDFPEAFKDKSRLCFYSSYCNSIEINSSFYKIPQRPTFERWRTEVPEDFRFTIKLFREITHARELKFDPTLIDKFLIAADGLGDKKGCLLVQFPGKISIDYYEQVEDILMRIKDLETGWRISVELRNPAWYIPETYELIDYLQASLVIHDKSKGANSRTNNRSEHIYFRFHGPDGNYRGAYSNEHLETIAGEMISFLEKGKTVFSYFNNTMGPALENLQTLQSIISKKYT